LTRAWQPSGRGWWRRAYVSTAFGCPYTGRVEPSAVVAVGRRLLDMGADEICFGDTIGVGVPDQVATLTETAIAGGIPIERIAVHFHDTYGQGLANVLTAIELGVTVVDASIGGIGGSPFAKHASGNLATEDVVWMLDGMGIATGLDIRKLAATTRWMSAQLGRELPGRAARALLA